MFTAKYFPAGDNFVANWITDKAWSGLVFSLAPLAGGGSG